VAWIVMLIGGVSTLFINGNPLLRFDGYYVLADALEIPNLAPRARRYLVYLFEHYILGLPERRSDGPASGERAWLIGYGIASFAYRMVVLLAIAIFVSDRFFLAGALLLLAVLALQLVLPIWRGIQRLRRDPRTRERPRRLLVASAALAGVALACLFVPAPTWTRSEGVVWLPERAQVRARADGFVRRILVAPGTRVEAEAPLVETEDPLQTARLRVLEARLRELRARYHSQRREDRVEAEILVEAIESANAELAEARARADEGLIVAGGAGRLVLPAAEDLPGRFLHRGDVLGYVADLSTPIVRTVVSQNDVIRVRSATRGVEVRLAEGIVLPAAIEREVPAADSRLPSTALGSAGGGRLAIDTRDADGLTVTEPVFQLDLALPPDAPVSGIGARVHVRFEHPPEPLAAQLVRALRRLFLGRLDA
jgi:putative peptide zinc metalloprotease protein